MKPPKHEWFKRRGYVHFDGRLDAMDAEGLVADPARVARHEFKPLIWYNETTRVWKRYKKSKGDARPPNPQPVGGPPKAAAAQARVLRAREARGEQTNRGRWKTKRRPIARASHRDAAIFSYYHHLLRDRYEQMLSTRGLSPVVLAYRRILRDERDGRGKASFHFAAEAFADIQRMGKCEVACLDIKGFFDNIPHELLKKQYANVLGCERLPEDHYHVLNAVMRYSRVSLRRLRAALDITVREYRRMCRSGSPFRAPHKTFERLRLSGLIERNDGNARRGIPQGLPISGFFANIAMLEFDGKMNALAKGVGGSYRRYSDDILLIAPVGALKGLTTAARGFINGAGMSIPEDKASDHVFSLDQAGQLTVSKPLTYLGLEFDGAHVRIKAQTLARLDKRMRAAIRRAARAAACAWDGAGPLRVRRRELYNLYSPLCHRRSRSKSPDKREWRGDFTDYARDAKDAVNMAFEDKSRGQVLRQLHARMNRLHRCICAEELERAEKELRRRTRSAARRADYAHNQRMATMATLGGLGDGEPTVPTLGDTTRRGES